jgi:hypothetical protein
MLEVIWTPGSAADVSEQTLQDHAKILVDHAEGGTKLDIDENPATPKTDRRRARLNRRAPPERCSIFN